MKSTLSEREGNTVKLDVEVSSEELQEAFEDRLKQLTREVRIPGFRQGKVPAAMARQRLGEEAIMADTLEEYVGRWFTGAVLELGLDPVDRPSIEPQEEAPELGKPFAFKATVTVMPEVVLGEYKGVEAPKESAELDDAEVDGQFDRLRDQFAELRPVETRAAQTGDYITADFSATLDGQPVEEMTAVDFAYELGADRIFPEIEAQTVGMKTGEERSFPVTLPEELGDERFAGKTVDFTVKLKEIKEKVLPPYTDHWVTEISEFKTLLELRQDIRKRLAGAKEYSVNQRFRALAVKAVADNATLDLPDVVVTEQAEEMVDDFKRSLESQGADFETYLESSGVTVPQMVEDMKPQAAANVKTGLVLDAVAKAEGITVSDAEVTASVQEMAAAGRVDPKAFESRLRQSGRIQGVKWQLLRDKAADFVVANAIATKPVVEPAEESAEAPATKTTRKKTAVKADAATAEETAEKTAEKPAPKPRTAAKKTDKAETPAKEEA